MTSKAKSNSNDWEVDIDCEEIEFPKEKAAGNISSSSGFVNSLNTSSVVNTSILSQSLLNQSVLNQNVVNPYVVCPVIISGLNLDNVSTNAYNIDDAKQLKAILGTKDTEIVILKNEVEKFKRLCEAFKTGNGALAAGIDIGGVQKKKRKYSDEVDNINAFIERNPSFSKEQIGDGFKIYCNICKEYGRQPTKKAKLTTGVEFTGTKAAEIESGHTKSWYVVKNSLHNHMEAHKNDEFQVIATKNILSVVLTSIKLKCTGENFDNLLVMTRMLGVEIGSKDHSKWPIPKLTKALRWYALNKVSRYLATPLPQTSLPPHFSVAFDKITINRQNCQTIIITVRMDGTPKTIPIDCSVINRSSDTGSSSKQHKEEVTLRDVAEVAINVLTNNLQIRKEDMVHITAIYADGKYGDLIHTYMKRMLRITDDYFFLSIWNAAEWIDVSVKKVWHALKFCDFFVKRCHKFQSVFKISKVSTNIKEEDTVNSINNTVVIDSSEFDGSVIEYEGSRFACMFLKELKSYFQNFPSLFSEYEDKMINDDVDESVKYFLSGRDFLMDLCAVIDILSPIAELISRIRSRNVAPWKIASWFPRLFKVLKEMGDDLKKCIDQQHPSCPDQNYFQYLNPNWDGIVEEKRLYDAWHMVNGRNFNTSPDEVRLFKIRDIRSCVYDYVLLCEQMRKAIAEKYQSVVSGALRELRNCFDLEIMLEDLAIVDEVGDDKRDDYMADYYQKGEKEFESFFSFLKRRPHLSKYFDVSRVKEIFRSWKTLFHRLIWRESHNVNRWFFNAKDEQITLTCEIEKIQIESEEGILNTFYALYLKDGTIVNDVRFKEEEFMKFLTQSGSPLLDSVDRELHIVIDYVYSLYGSATCFENFYGVMRTHERDCAQYHEALVDRTIVDSLFPTAIQCQATLKDVAVQLYNSGKFCPIYTNKRHKETEYNKVIDKINKGPLKYPFLLHDDDVNKQQPQQQ